jgi:hypothetical protein
MNQSGDPHPTIEERYRTLFMLWFAICTSVLMLLVLVRFTPVQIKTVGPACPDCLSSNLRLSLILNGLAVIPMALSFLVKQQILARAVAAQRLDLVQSGYVVAFALCEASALLGLVDHFSNGSHYFYVAFIFAGLGLLLHFPRKQHLLDAAQQEL